MWKSISLLLTMAACGFPRPADVVACTPGEFSACRGDTELTCSSDGTDYDAVQCARGCDPAIGCRLCDANQTVCTNGKVQSCDATGAVTASEACPLGCFEDQPRCREIDPSNDLARYMDMTTAAPDLDLATGGTIFTDTGIVNDSADRTLPIPSFLIPAPAGGSAIRVLVANHVILDGTINVTVSRTSLGPALAIVAHNKITVDGTLNFSPDYTNAVTVTAGGLIIPDCIGGHSAEWTTATSIYFSGTGGGGHATAGGKGGAIVNLFQDPFTGGPGGKIAGNPTLVPLRGGCGGGADGPTLSIMAPGGGALQLSSRIAIIVNSGSIINLNGGPGLTGRDAGGPVPAYGGGAGGGILLEAPTISLLDSVRLLVNGGGGASNADVKPTSTTTMTTPGGEGDSITYTNGGNGAALDGSATDGADLVLTAAMHSFFYAGSGGGGLGFIRLNTASGIYTKASNVTESGVLTTGTLRTR